MLSYVRPMLRWRSVKNKRGEGLCPIYVGIDFGTSTLYVTSWDEEKQLAEPVPNLIPSEYGSSLATLIMSCTMRNQVIWF